MPSFALQNRSFRGEEVWPEEAQGAKKGKEAPNIKNFRGGGVGLGGGGIWRNSLCLCLFSGSDFNFFGQV